MKNEKKYDTSKKTQKYNRTQDFHHKNIPHLGLELRIFCLGGRCLIH